MLPPLLGAGTNDGSGEGPMSKPLHGIMGRILEVDLTSGRVGSFSPPEEDWLALLGGKGLGVKLLLQLLPAGVDPLGPDNILIFTAGLLTGSGAPCTSRFSLVTKSPLTGGIGAANCGGTFGMHLRRAGYDGLVVRGRAEQPVHLEIRDGRVRLRDARHLWGLDTVQTQAALPGGGKHIGALVIGPAGEHLVRYATIMSGHRALARTGVGAVMGAKNLKAITAAGTQTLPVADPAGFAAAVEGWTRLLQGHPITGTQLPRFGTAGLASTANATHTLPVRNFQRGHAADLGTASGEGMADTILLHNEGCRSCPIRCARVVALDGKPAKGPEFETLGMFGPNQGTFDVEVITRLGLECDRLGLDTISCGSTLAFAMELTERGLLQSGLRFGDPGSALAALDEIAHRRGLGDELAEGTLRLSRRYGGADFAPHAKGLEFASYEPRGAVGLGLGYAVGNRGGCHIDAGYLVFFEALGPLQVDPLAPEGKPALTVMQQNLMDATSQAGCCIFTTYAVLPGGLERFVSLHGRLAGWLSKALLAGRVLLDHQAGMPAWMMPLHLPLIPHSRALSALTGRSITLGSFIAAGERGHTLARLLNLREGLSARDDALPRRLTDEPERAGEPRSVVPLARMLPRYYQVRGWDDRGVPRAKLLRALGLEGLEPVRRAVLLGLERAPAEREARLEAEGDALRARLVSVREQAAALTAARAELTRQHAHQELQERAREVRGAGFTVLGERCAGCGLCQQACPVPGAIRWAPGSKAVIDAALCVRCGRCEEACPPRFAAIERTPWAAGSPAPPIYRVQEDACSKCGLCHPACPVGAVRWKKRARAVIDEEICVRCGLCQQACPPKFAAIASIPEGASCPSA